MIEQTQAREAAERIGDFRVIDVREPWEFDGPLGHIAGAELVPLGSLEPHGDRLVGVRPLLMVCRSGRRSNEAALRLADGGRNEVLNLAGGMIAWQRAGLPVERREPGSREALFDEMVAWVAQVSGRSHAASRAALGETTGGAAGHATPVDGSQAALAACIEKLESLFATDPPADLDLASAAFRRSLGGLRQAGRGS